MGKLQVRLPKFKDGVEWFVVVDGGTGEEIRCKRRAEFRENIERLIRGGERFGAVVVYKNREPENVEYEVFDR